MRFLSHAASFLRETLNGPPLLQSSLAGNRTDAWAVKGWRGSNWASVKADINERAAPPSCWVLVKFELNLKYESVQGHSCIKGGLKEDFTP